MTGGDGTDARWDGTSLSIEEHIENLRVEGVRLGTVADTTAFGAAIPGCPGWTLEDLVRHVGDVHRWAATIVRESLQERLRRDFVGPGNDALLDWYAQGHRELVQTLSDASPRDEFWAWAPAPNALAFWARRQAHETAIHRLDAEQAGGSVTPFHAVQAADGIDEWLTIASRRVRSTSGGGRVLHLAPVDVPAAWMVGLEAEGLSLRNGEPAGRACTVRGPASDLFALAMNRRHATGLVVEGDDDVLRAWRESVHF